MKRNRAAGWLRMAIAGICGTSLADYVPPSWANNWRPELGFFDSGPSCLLYAPEPMGPDGLLFQLSWSARDRYRVYVSAEFERVRSIEFETDDGGHWNASVQPQTEGVRGRMALIGVNVADGLLRNLEQAHPLTVVVTRDDRAPLRYRLPATGAQIGVPMYRACIKSVTDHPPKYFFDPGRQFLGSYLSGERCEFEQIIQLEHIPVQVTLTAMADGGEMDFQRGLHSQNFEGPFYTRKPPDRIEPQALFGQTFDLVEEHRYRITIDQLNELTARLAEGSVSKFNLTTPEGNRTTLGFGGSLGMPFGAMFAACREARFSTRESTRNDH